MRILWVTTKSPWPMVDGGRVLMVHTLRALTADGHEPVLVSPFDPGIECRDELHARLREFCVPYLRPSPPNSWVGSLRTLRQGLPLAVGRHALPAVRAEVDRLLSSHPFDVVHAEQIQSLANCEPARRLLVPIVLRAQNVESDLWAALATRTSIRGRLMRWESRRFARFEGRTMREVASAVALTVRDAERLRALAGGHGRIHHLPAPFPSPLPAGAKVLDGKPAVVVLANDWFPNRDGVAWFVEDVWPAVRAQSPAAMLHVFGAFPGGRIARAPAVVGHPPPADSAVAFPPAAILAVPLRIASGVRIKILEAWARGVPVVASPAAAAGLEASHGEELLIARDPREFAAIIQRVHGDPQLRRALVEGGRARLNAHHDPRQIGRGLVDVYAEVADRARR